MAPFLCNCVSVGFGAVTVGWRSAEMRKWCEVSVACRDLNVTCLPQRGSVRVDSLEDFAYGSKVLINTMDKVTC